MIHFRKWGVFCCACLVFSSFCFAQAPAQVPLNRDYQFAPGIYHSFTDLRQNQPSAELPLASYPMVHLAEDYRVQIEHTPDNQAALDRAYAIVVGGIPYLKTRSDSARAFSEFSGLRIRGRLCLMTFDTTYQYEQEFYAYNPFNQRPFLKKSEERSERVRVGRILDFATGAWYPFTREAVGNLVAEDRELSKAIEVLSPEEQAEKLYRCLLIYDDRHPIYMPAPNLARE